MAWLAAAAVAAAAAVGEVHRRPSNSVAAVAAVATALVMVACQLPSHATVARHCPTPLSHATVTPPSYATVPRHRPVPRRCRTPLSHATVPRYRPKPPSRPTPLSHPPSPQVDKLVTPLHFLSNAPPHIFDGAKPLAVVGIGGDATPIGLDCPHADLTQVGSWGKDYEGAWIRWALYKSGGVMTFSLADPALTTTHLQGLAELVGNPMDPLPQAPVLPPARAGAPRFHEDFKRVMVVERRAVKPARVFGDVWHTDGHFFARPPHFTMQRAVAVTPNGTNPTQFASAMHAFQRLPQAFKLALQRMTQVHSAFLAFSPLWTTWSAADGDERKIDRKGWERDVHHPLVAAHPYGDVQSLYVATPAECPSIVNSTTNEVVAGWEDLVRQLERLITAPSNVFNVTHHPNKVILYDNRLVMHRAVAEDWSVPRSLERILSLDDDGVPPMATREPT